MILVIDNYDSFTFNLVDFLRHLGAETQVERNDAITPAKALTSGAKGIIVSPGPGRPEQAGISLAVVKTCLEAGMPLLGICLGHQAIAQALGAEIVPAPRVMHGKSCAV